MKTTKGQGTALTILFAMIVFGLVYFVGLASMVSEIGSAAVIAGNLTGVNAFFYSNINLFIGFFYIIALIVVGRIGV